MNSLYEISDSIANLLARIDEDTGEIPDDLAASLSSLEMDFQHKAATLCRYRANARAEADGITVEIDRLTAMRNRAERKAEWIRQYLHDAMKRSGLERLEVGLWRLRIQKNSRPAISYEGNIPNDYQRLEVVFDGARAYDDWKSGLAMPEGVVVKHGDHLRIS